MNDRKIILTVMFDITSKNAIYSLINFWLVIDAGYFDFFPKTLVAYAAFKKIFVFEYH